MVKEILSTTMLVGALVACFEPTTPHECEGRICAEPSEQSGHVPAGSGGGSAMAQGGQAEGGLGGLGGNVGGDAAGGAGGGVALSISIVAPVDGATIGHGQLIWFEATVTAPGEPPGPDSIRWQSSQYQGELFGIGYQFQEQLGIVGPHTITVGVFQGDNMVASDSVMVTSQ